MANPKVKVKIDLSGIKRKVGPLSLQRAQMAMANQMLLDMSPFVPHRFGDLEASGHVIQNGERLEWSPIYARAQFYGTNGKAVFKNYTTSGTGKRWDEKASRLYIDRWEQVYLKGMGL